MQISIAVTFLMIAVYIGGSLIIPNDADRNIIVGFLDISRAILTLSALLSFVMVLIDLKNN